LGKSIKTLEPGRRDTMLSKQGKPECISVNSEGGFEGWQPHLDAALVVTLKPSGLPPAPDHHPIPIPSRA